MHPKGVRAKENDTPTTLRHQETTAADLPSHRSFFEGSSRHRANTRQTDTERTDTMSAPAFALPALPYDYSALEPHIDATTMTIHHTKHHNTYVNNMNTVCQKVSRNARRHPRSLPLHLPRSRSLGALLLNARASV